VGLRQDLQLCPPVLCRITIVYRPTVALFQESYAELYEKLRGTYGVPQGSAPPLDRDCMTSLPGCLEAGKVVTGAYEATRDW
jgi:hypothetical protein